MARNVMTVCEVVQLVVQAGAIGRDGEVLILDMGEPIKIDDVARRMAAYLGDRQIAIVETSHRRLILS